MQTIKGYYMYLEASTGNINDTARLVKKTTPTQASTLCLTFWSHMYGDHIGTLNVYTGYDGKWLYFRLT